MILHQKHIKLVVDDATKKLIQSSADCSTELLGKVLGFLDISSHFQ